MNTWGVFEAGGATWAAEADFGESYVGHPEVAQVMSKGRDGILPRVHFHGDSFSRDLNGLYNRLPWVVATSSNNPWKDKITAIDTHSFVQFSPQNDGGYNGTILSRRGTNGFSPSQTGAASLIIPTEEQGNTAGWWITNQENGYIAFPESQYGPLNDQGSYGGASGGRSYPISNMHSGWVAFWGGDGNWGGFSGGIGAAQFEHARLSINRISSYDRHFSTPWGNNSIFNKRVGVRVLAAHSDEERCDNVNWYLCCDAVNDPDSTEEIDLSTGWRFGATEAGRWRQQYDGQFLVGATSPAFGGISTAYVRGINSAFWSYETENATEFGDPHFDFSTTGTYVDLIMRADAYPSAGKWSPAWNGGTIYEIDPDTRRWNRGVFFSHTAESSARYLNIGGVWNPTDTSNLKSHNVENMRDYFWHTKLLDEQPIINIYHFAEEGQSASTFNTVMRATQDAQEAAGYKYIYHLWVMSFHHANSNSSASTDQSEAARASTLVVDRNNQRSAIFQMPSDLKAAQISIYDELYGIYFGSSGRSSNAANPSNKYGYLVGNGYDDFVWGNTTGSVDLTGGNAEADAYEIDLLDSSGLHIGSNMSGVENSDAGGFYAYHFWQGINKQVSNDDAQEKSFAASPIKVNRYQGVGYTFTATSSTPVILKPQNINPQCKTINVQILGSDFYDLVFECGVSGGVVDPDTGSLRTGKNYQNANIGIPPNAEVRFKPDPEGITADADVTFTVRMLS